MAGLYEAIMAASQQSQGGLWSGLMQGQEPSLVQQVSPAQPLPAQPIPQTLRNKPIQEWLESQANMRGPQDQAAANPGMFTPPEYIMDMRRKQEDYENNNLVRRLFAGKEI